MPPTLEHTFTLRGFFAKAHMLDIQTIKGGPQRTVAPIVSGFMKGVNGNDLEAEVIPGGGDWLLIDPTTLTAHLDVRLGLKIPSTGHSIYIRYEGTLQVDAASYPQLTGGSNAKSTSFGDHEWFTYPIFETSDPELKWVETVSWLGEGRWVVEGGEVGIEYRVWRVGKSKG